MDGGQADGRPHVVSALAEDIDQKRGWVLPFPEASSEATTRACWGPTFGATS